MIHRFMLNAGSFGYIRASAHISRRQISKTSA
jgi:hypothetical protein